MGEGGFASLAPKLTLTRSPLEYPRSPEHTNPKHHHLVDPIWIGRPLAVNGDILGDDDEALEPNAYIRGRRGRCTRQGLRGH